MISMIEERKRDMEREKQELEEIINREKKKGMNIREIIKEGNPVEEILKTIENEKIDLVVLRAQEEGRIERRVEQNHGGLACLHAKADEICARRMGARSAAVHFMISGSNDAIIRKMPCSIFLVKDELAPDAQEH